MSSTVLPSAFYPLPAAGWLRLSGPDRRAFLQRQSTNHINLLTPERSLLTVLTNPIARILDVFILLEETDAITILTLPGYSESTHRYLRSRIFFNDKVTISNESASYTHYELFGPAATAALERLGLPNPTEANAVSPGPDGLRVLRHEAAFGLGFRLLSPAPAAPSVAAVLTSVGLEQLSPEAYDQLRIERGLPAAGRELTEDYTPLEAGLRATVSDNKGCYTGQEIIARQITYDKVTRLLCGLRLSAPASLGADLLSQDGAPAGKLTSVANSPSFGWLGLAVVKRPYNQPGTVLHSGDITADVSELPFLMK